MRRAPHYIAVEGPLRVGKTKLAKALAAHIHGRTVLDVPDNPHIEGFLTGRSGAAFRAQMHFLIGRYEQLSGAAITRSQMPIVTDFLFEKDKVFACLNLDDDEMGVYDTYYSHFKRQLPDPDLTIYLKASAESLLERLSSERTGLEARISAAYLEGAVRAFDHFFSRYKAADILVVDTAETDIVQRPEDLEDLLRELSRPVSGTQFFLPLGK